MLGALCIMFKLLIKESVLRQLVCLALVLVHNVANFDKKVI